MPLPHHGQMSIAALEDTYVVTPVQKIITVWESVVIFTLGKHFTELAKFKANSSKDTNTKGWSYHLDERNGED